MIGCSVDTYDIKQNTVSLTVLENPNLDTLGRAYWSDGKCIIVLKEYPTCLAHEVRHCLEGHWHKTPSDRDCY
jgi:hypothetical protein